MSWGGFRHVRRGEGGDLAGNAIFSPGGPELRLLLSFLSSTDENYTIVKTSPLLQTLLRELWTEGGGGVRSLEPAAKRREKRRAEV